MLHSQYGSAIFVTSGTIVNTTSLTDINNIEILRVDLNGISVTSVYKPAGERFSFHQPLAAVGDQQQVIIGDFNSHSLTWGYATTNTDGELVEDWAENQRLSLIHDPKLPSSFNSGRWRRVYDPDIIFATNRIAGCWNKIVMEPVPRSQHRPIGVQVNAAITVQTVPFRRRFNLKKANWEQYAYQLDAAVENIPAQPNAMTSSWTPYEKSPERTSLVGVEGTMSQAWHPSPSNWSKNTEINTKTIPLQIALSLSGRNWWAPSERNAVKHGRHWSNQQTWPTTARRRGPWYASSVTTHASQSSTATPLLTKWHTNSCLTEEYRTDNRKYASIDSDTRTTRDSREHSLQRNSTSASEYWKTAKHPAWMTSKRSWSSSLDPRHATGYFVFSTTALRLRKFRRSGDRLR